MYSGKIQRGLVFIFIFLLFAVPLGLVINVELGKEKHRVQQKVADHENDTYPDGDIVKVRKAVPEKTSQVWANLEDIKKASSPQFPLRYEVDEKTETEWIKGELENYLILREHKPALTGQDVKGVQNILQKLHFYQGKIDGVYNITTIAAVRKFQEHYGLEPTGIMDLDDYNLLANCYEDTIPVANQKGLIRPTGKISLLVILDERTLYVFDDGKLFTKFPVAIGTVETPTPLGSWIVVGKDTWGEGFGTRWIALNVPYGRFGIHGTDKPWSIGLAESHGCVRMYNRDIEILYQWVKYGVRVNIVGGQFPYNTPWRDMRDGDRGSDVWILQNRLRELGYLPYKPDGVYGAGTKRAVLTFQKDNKLRQTGYVTPETLYKLGLYLFQ